MKLANQNPDTIAAATENAHDRLDKLAARTAHVEKVLAKLAGLNTTQPAAQPQVTAQPVVQPQPVTVVQPVAQPQPVAQGAQPATTDQETGATAAIAALAASS